MRKPLVLIIAIIALTTGIVYAWTEPVRMSDSLGPDAPKMIAVGETLHVVSTWPKGYYMRSNDNGLTWTNPIIPVDTSHYMENPDLKYSKGLLHLIWKEVGDNPPLTWQLYHSSSSDGGMSWNQPNQVYNNSDRTMSFPSLATNGDTLFLACAFDGYYLFFKSIDGGLTWQDSSLVDSGPLLIIQPPILLYSSGILHLIYPMGVDADSFGFEIYYKRSSDSGQNWSVRTILSPAELAPNYVHSTMPSAFADSLGHVLVVWKDYLNGSMCGISGDIFSRVSVDNGLTWQPWTNITIAQSGYASSCLILQNEIYVIWMDFQYFGCGNSKIYYSNSSDWGNSWRNPEMISGEVHLPDNDPCLTYTIDQADTILHVVMSRDCPAQYLYYIRNHDFVGVEDDNAPIMPYKIDIHSYPNPFNSSTMITFENPEGGVAELEIYNILGQSIWSTNLNGKEGGVIWNAKDKDGNGVSSGIYFARVTTASDYRSIKLMYLK